MITERANEVAESGINERIKVHGAPKSSKHKVPDPIVEVNDTNQYYVEKHALKNTYMDIPKNKATTFIGPPGCGKSTLLRCFNRVNDLVDSARVEGEMPLMDEPCSALDPKVIVTRNMRQASRVSDFTAFMYLGKLIEYDTTETIFLNPKYKQTEDYVSGKFG